MNRWHTSQASKLNSRAISQPDGSRSKAYPPAQTLHLQMFLTWNGQLGLTQETETLRLATSLEHTMSQQNLSGQPPVAASGADTPAASAAT